MANFNFSFNSYRALIEPVTLFKTMSSSLALKKDVLLSTFVYNEKFATSTAVLKKLCTQFVKLLNETLLIDSVFSSFIFLEKKDLSGHHSTSVTKLNFNEKYLLDFLLPKGCPSLTHHSSEDISIVVQRVLKTDLYLKCVLKTIVYIPISRPFMVFIAKENLISFGAGCEDVKNIQETFFFNLKKSVGDLFVIMRHKIEPVSCCYCYCFLLLIRFFYSFSYRVDLEFFRLSFYYY